MGTTVETINDSVFACYQTGVVMLRSYTLVLRGDTEICRAHHEEKYRPGDDISELPEGIKALCLHVWASMAK